MNHHSSTTAPPARRALRLAAATAALVAVLAACGGGSDTASTTTKAAGTSTTASSTKPTATTTGVSDAPAEPSKGCTPTTEDAKAVTAEKHTMDIDGNDRWYLLTTPGAAGGADPRPLVMDFHGLGEGAELQSTMSAMGTLGQKEGFVTVQPEGNHDGPFASWSNKPDSPDMNFVEAMLDEVEASQCIDLNRVYATGLSAGAFMTSGVGCALADRVAAIAPVAGIQHPDTCAPGRPIPVLSFHGTADPILKFNGGVGTDALTSGLNGGAGGASTTTTTGPVADLEGPGYPEAVRAWAAANGCEPTPKDTEVSDEVLHRVYDCPEGADVEFYVIKGGGHAWPGSAFSQKIEKVIGHTTMDIDATELDWAFFQRFALPR